MIHKFIPSRIRERLRPYRQGLQDQFAELCFLYHRAERVAKRSKVEGMKSISDLYEFAREDFWISQIKTEIVPYLELVKEREPERVAEIGTYLSGNCFLFSRVFQKLKLLVAVDLKVKHQEKLRYYAPSELEIHCLHGYSCAPETLHRVRLALGDHSLDSLFIDGDHEYLGARSDLIEYSKWVRPGGLIAFHDIVSDHLVRFGRVGPFYAGEVYLLWRQLKRRFRHWEFIADPDQNGAGIGVIEWDQDGSAKLAALAKLDKNAE